MQYGVVCNTSHAEHTLVFKTPFFLKESLNVFFQHLFLTAWSARAAARRLCCVDIGRAKKVWAGVVTRQSIDQLLFQVGLRGPNQCSTTLALVWSIHSHPTCSQLASLDSSGWTAVWSNLANPDTGARPGSPALGQSLRGPKLWPHETTGRVNTTFCLIH